MLREQCLLLYSPRLQPGKGAVCFQAWPFPYKLTIMTISPQSCPQTNMVSMISVKLAAPGLPGTWDYAGDYIVVPAEWLPGVSLEPRLVFGVVKVEG